MKYYVVADIHSYFDEMRKALDEQGFFDDTQPHKLIVCGDLLDRGNQPKQVQDFILSLQSEDVILIRGNHEDLLESMLNNWLQEPYYQSHHVSNGTTNSVLLLSGHNASDLDYRSEDVYRDFVKTPFARQILPHMVDYYETKHYVFTHGWIPCVKYGSTATDTTYLYMPNWRKSNSDAWKKARWINGMDAAHQGAVVPNKTVVCGHWHCSYGHHTYEGKGENLGETSIFTPYYAKGIIAIDACTAYSGIVNCIVIEDEEL